MTILFNSMTSDWLKGFMLILTNQIPACELLPTDVEVDIPFPIERRELFSLVLKLKSENKV